MSFPYVAALSYRAPQTQYAATRALHVGALGMTEDGTLYRLCKAGADLTNTLAAKINYFTLLEGLTGAAIETTAAAITAGDTTVTITDATNSRAKEYYKDGYFVIPSSGTYDTIKHIWKSDAEVSNTYKLYLSSPMVYDYAAGGTVMVYPSPHRDIRNAGAYSAGNEHFAAMVNLPITSAYYFWGKVRGPHWCWFAGIGGNWPGADAGDRELMFHINGAVDLLDRRVHTSTLSSQRAGHLMYSGTYGDTLCYMELE